MKALIFAAGLGTRLKPITESIPKALVPVQGKPLLEIVIQRLKEVGVNEILINIHHFPDQIIDFVHSNNDFGIKVDFSDERDLLLDTGGGLKKAAWFFDDNQPFFVHNVDILSDIDLKKMYSKHIESKAIATLFVSQRETSRYLLFDQNNRLKGWYNRQSGETKPKEQHLNPEDYSQLAFNGIHVISLELFSLMDAQWQGKFSIIDFYLSIAQSTNIQAFQQPLVHITDVGKLDILEQLQ